ncbi:hypothetical protein OIE66_33170 [Nonomuraea sp. NBC_01738]|uniref:hypothetical protein n=1 Tax=Nonomuraea sp. NBC_01738 TaxID=2976003 RepID=UPI002E101428|nr:hypothetical protein OIE66_33170 [Nonomuraea sp. NBC_01738]
MTRLIRSLAVAATSVAVLSATAPGYPAHAATGSSVDCVVSNPADYNGRTYKVYAPKANDATTKIPGTATFYEYNDDFNVTDVYPSDAYRIYAYVQYCYDGAWRPYEGADGSSGWYNAGHTYNWDIKEGRRMKIQVCRTPLGGPDATCSEVKEVVA